MQIYLNHSLPITRIGCVTPGNKFFGAIAPQHRHVSRLNSVSDSNNESVSAKSNTIDHLSLSESTKEVIQEAQENILALHRSRLKALTELKAAREKIAELEKKLEEATMQVTSLMTVQQQPTSLVKTNQDDNTDTASNGSTASNNTVGVVAGAINLVYETGWENAYLHCRQDNGKWTLLPGLPIPQCESGEYAGAKLISLPCSRLEFVVHNGLGKFDTPNPYGLEALPKNYAINTPGVYRLKSGRLVKLS